MSKIKQWLLENYELQTIQEITEHGCVSGICGDLIYYKDTVKFHDFHECEIWDMLNADMDEYGSSSILELLSNFNGAKDVGSMDQFKNLLAWYAVEREARLIIDEKENEGSE